METRKCINRNTQMMLEPVFLLGMIEFEARSWTQAKATLSAEKLCSFFDFILSHANMASPPRHWIFREVTLNETSWKRVGMASTTCFTCCVQTCIVTCKLKPELFLAFSVVILFCKNESIDYANVDNEPHQAHVPFNAFSRARKNFPELITEINPTHECIVPFYTKEVLYFFDTAINLFPFYMCFMLKFIKCIQ